MTVLTAAVMGGIAGARGIGISVVESSTLGGMVAIIVEKVVKGTRDCMKKKKTKSKKTKKKR